MLLSWSQLALLKERDSRLQEKTKYLAKVMAVPLTIFILLPQFGLVGIADAFVEVAKLELFYDQAPESMKSLGTSYFTSTWGIGQFLSSFLLKTVADMTKRHGHKGWILDNLNASHLDYYYAFLAILNVLNFFFFLLIAKHFVYNVDVTESKRGIAMETSSKASSQDNEVSSQDNEVLKTGLSL